MAWLKRKTDPISDRARTLNDEIAELESQIKRLDARVQRNHLAHPRLRSTAIPQVGIVSHPSQAPAADPEEPIFEEVDRNRLKTRAESVTPEHFNDLGVRKYDLPALLRRIRNQFRGPSTTNPKLVSYLAAGGIQGLRPMRFEKRVARNRLIFLALILFFTLLGIITVFVRHR